MSEDERGPVPDVKGEGAPADKGARAEAGQEAAAAPAAGPEAPAAGAEEAAASEPAGGTQVEEPAPRDEETPAAPSAPSRPIRRGRPRDALAERPEEPVEVPRARLAARSRRDFILSGAGLLAAALGGWWLLPPQTRERWLPWAKEGLDGLAARVGLTPRRREALMRRGLEFDDDVAEALYSKDRSVRTYDRSQAQPLRNNYNGRTPGREYLATWSLQVSGLASGRIERLAIGDLLRRFEPREQVTRLVCVEGWSAVAWWGGIRFADLLTAYPPAPGARWAALRSAVNLDGDGDPDPYYVSIDLDTARHPQTLLATHHRGRPLTVDHGAPLRLVAPMKLGLKNIKAITEIAFSAAEPPDYWNERGYSGYDGL